MARRAKKISAYNLARLNQTIVKREQEEIAQQLRREIARGIQSSAIAIMNGLVEVGPAWSGRFSASWRFLPEGATPGDSGPEGEIYRYTGNDLRITLVEKYMKGGRTGPSSKIAEVTQFKIINTAADSGYPLANVAIDSEIAVFRRGIAKSRGWPKPLKKPKLGDDRNNPGLRYEIGNPFPGTFEEAPASMTAEPDWYYTYLLGGQFNSDFANGFARGFTSKGGETYSTTLPSSF